MGDVVKAARTADVRMARELQDALYGTMSGTRTRRIANGNERMAMIINQLQRRCCGALSAQPASVITVRGLCVVHARSFRPLVSRLRYESFEHEHCTLSRTVVAVRDAHTWLRQQYRTWFS